jgi:hypothetical protein
MTKTLSIRFAGLALAAFAFSACFAPEDSDDEDVLELESAVKAGGKSGGGDKGVWDDNSTAVLGECYHGATTHVYPVNISAPRCTLSKVYDLVSWAESDGQVELKSFLLDAIDGHAKIQCRSYVDPDTLATKWCADVIDRFQDNSPLVKGTVAGVDTRNYFVAYTGDADGSADKNHWDQQIGSGVWAAPPIELSETGFILKDGQFVVHYDRTWNSPGSRLLKFDPRGCGGCLLYQGPAITHLTNFAEISNGWWPTFDGSNCNMQQYFGGPLVHLSGSSLCLSEQNYRATSR